MRNELSLRRYEPDQVPGTLSTAAHGGTPNAEVIVTQPAIDAHCRRLAIDRGEELLALDLALQKLSVQDERKSRIVELRYFGGLSVEETSEVLSVSVATVMRDWRLARAWLSKELAG